MFFKQPNFALAHSVLNEDYSVSGDLEVVFGPCDSCTFPLESEFNSISILHDAILENSQSFAINIPVAENTVPVDAAVSSVLVTIVDEGEFP